MNRKIILSGLFVATLLLGGMWVTAYFTLAKAQKIACTSLEAKGYDVVWEGVKTSGFPFAVSRTMSRAILTTENHGVPIYVQTADVTFSLSLFSPRTVQVMTGPIKVSVDHTAIVHCGGSKSTLLLDTGKRGISNALLLDEVHVNLGNGSQVEYPKLSLKWGDEQHHLFVKGSAERFQVNESTPIEASSFRIVVESPYSSWVEMASALERNLDILESGVHEAVQKGGVTLPILEEMVHTLEEQQIALHLNTRVQMNSRNYVEATFDLGIVDNMPHGDACANGTGSLYESLKEYVMPFVGPIHTAGSFDISIRPTGIFCSGKNVLRYTPVTWGTAPFIQEPFICETLGLYTHGDFRKLRAEGQKVTEQPEVQYEIGEGFLLDARYDRALTWFKRAGLQHHPKALLHMAYHFYNGYGCDKNEGLAREFMEDAVCQGIPLRESLRDFVDRSFVSWAAAIVGSDAESDK